MLEQLRNRFGEAIQEAQEVGRELRLRAAPAALGRLARACKEAGFSYPADVTAVDTGEELRVVYRLVSLGTGQHVVISVGLPRSGGRVSSLSEVYQGTAWPEREVYDMFGVRFDGHPDLSRILLTEDWQGHPLLKSWQAK